MGQLASRLAAALDGTHPLGALEAGLVLLALLVGACAALLVVVALRTRGDAARRLEARLDVLAQLQTRVDRGVRDELARSREEVATHTRHLREEVGGALRGASEGIQKQLKDVQDTLHLQLHALRGENERKLEQMRATVDEKLQGTLEKRLGEAFQQVSERLEAVHKGLGEMQSLAVGVGDLKRVLTNVKTRGTFGETRLEALLDQTLAPAQWEREVQLRRGSAERVDFAIRFPGAEGDGGEPVWLPLDAKFPQEDYERLVDAQERASTPELEAAASALEQRVLQQARTIRDKYVCPPATTDFAVMFLPTEGLYAEVLRRPGLAERLQRECRVVVAGPTTVLALLNSLQMGFRTLAIQKRSAEVWRVLGAVKTEFGRFGDLLDKVDKKLQEASNTIGVASSRSRTIERRLRGVEELPDGEAARVLEDGSDDGDDG
ncbi:MAG: DNA recombination protein RmuC [Myxococcota bacterium]